jgi:O-methyltransferase
MRPRLLARRGLRGRREPTSAPRGAPSNFDDGFEELPDRVAHATMTSAERMHALYQAVNYVTDAGVAGDIVECGVWRGGSSMLSALVLSRRDDCSRTLWLYDTFEGMPAPGDEDVKFDGASARDVLSSQVRSADTMNDWCIASIDAVRANMEATGYPPDRIRLVEGLVEHTIPQEAPPTIAVLRLDTDWFQSTYHELVHLYPRLAVGGVLMIDDYGWWRGARDATDKYFAEHGVKMLLTRIDSTGRMGIKLK